MSAFRPMVGKLMAFVVFVEGPPGSSAELTARQKLSAGFSVMSAGLLLRRLSQTWGDRQAPRVPPACLFLVREHSVQLDLDPNMLTTGSGVTALENRWMTAAFDKMGFAAGTVSERIQMLREGLFARFFMGLGIADAFPIFITNYNCSHTAHHPRGSGTAIIAWTARSAFDSDNMDGVIAHEIGHIFDSRHEYGSCSTTEATGFFDDPNLNCAVGNPDPRELCVMDKNAHLICSRTPRHFGWVDDDHDGVPDLMARATVQQATRDVTPGSTITLTGRNVWDTRAVSFGNVVVPDPTKPHDPFPVVSPTPANGLATTSIQVVVPANVSGTVTISVLTRAGMSIAL